MGRTLGADLGATVLNQDIYEVSTTQKHRLGTRCVRGDCIYKYAQTKVAIQGIQYAVYAYYVQAINFGAVATVSPIGSNKIYITVGANDGPANDGVIAKHWLEGGHVMVYGATEYMNFGIVDNGAAVSGGTIEITLDGELPQATIVTSNQADVLCSQYKVCPGHSGTGVNRSFVGMPMRLAAADSYLWIKSWGPHGMTATANVGVGSGTTADTHRVVFKYNGTLQLADEDAYGTNAQHAGFICTRVYGETQGAPFVHLQISP